MTYAGAPRRRLALVAITCLIASCSDSPAGPTLPNPPVDIAGTIDAANHVILTWTARPAAENIALYSVYRNGFRIGDSPTTSLVDSLAPAEMSHSYSVASHAADGIISEASASISVFAPDATPPFVVSVTPPNGAVNVSATLPIRVTFSERMNSASITASAFDVRDATTGAALAGSATYDSATRTASWSPALPMPAEKRVNLTVTTEARDLRGNRLRQPHMLSFTIRESTVPFIVSFFPPEGAVIPVGTWPTVQFSERLQTTSGGATTGVRMLDKALGASGLWVDAAGFDTLTNTAHVVSGKRIQSLRTYTVEVNQAAVDLAGNPIASRFEFNFQFAEWTLPGIAAVFPEPGATGVARSGSVNVDLSAPIQPVNDYEPRISLRAAGTTELIPLTMIYALSSNRITAIYSDLKPITTYVATFYHFFTDSKGVRHEATREWTFTTGL